MHLDDELADRQPQAGATNGRIGSVGSIELFKKVGLLLRGQADAVIAHTDHDLGGKRLTADRDRAAFRRIFHGVRQDILNDLCQSERIGDERRKAIVHLDEYLMFWGGLDKDRADGVQQLPHIQWFKLEQKVMIGFQTRNIEQIIDELAELRTLVAD